MMNWEVAEKARVSVSTLTKHENGQVREPSLRVVASLLFALGYDEIKIEQAGYVESRRRKAS